MTREEAIRILDEVIPPPEHHTVDLDHLPIAQAWLCIKEMIKAEKDTERKVGEWIITGYHSNYDDWDDYTCPFCRKTFSRIYGARFCPSCGARLFDKDTNVPSKGENDG